jgi:hypothetical protein
VTKETTAPDTETKDDPVDKLLNPQDYDYETTRTMTLLSEDEQKAYAEGLDEPDVAPDPAAEPEPEPEPAKAAEPEPAPAPEPVRPQIHEIPEDVLTGDKLDTKLAEIAASRKELLKKYEDLEINADELDTQLTDLTTEAITLSKTAEHHQALRDRDLKAAKDADDQAQATFETKWNEQVEAYKAQYPALFEGDVLQHFDAVVRRVTAVTPLTPDTMLGALEDAHALLAKRQDKLGVKVPEIGGAPTPAPANPAPKPAPAAKPAAKADAPANPLGTVPRTLSQVPAAQAMPADDSRFAGLNDIVQGSPATLSEAAVKKLPQAEYEAWLAEG